MLYNKQSKSFFNPITGDQFIRLNTLDDIEKIKDQIQARRFKPDPIYLENESLEYWYPLWLLPNELRASPVIVVDTAPLILAEKTGEFFDSNGRKYIKVKDSTDYDKLVADYEVRRSNMDSVVRKIVDMTPVYLDPETGFQFYPKRVLMDKMELERSVLYRKPFLYCDESKFRL